MSVPATTFYPNFPNGNDTPLGVDVLSMRVTERIKGNGDDEITVLIPSRIAMAVHYDVGQDYVMCVDYCADLSCYLVRDFLDGTFERKTDSWENRSLFSSRPVQYRTSEIRAMTSSADLDIAMSSADCILVGTVMAFSTAREGGEDDARVVTTLNVGVQRLLRGGLESDTIVVLWHDDLASVRIVHAPQMIVGETWYMILHQEGNVFKPVDGPNSFLKLDHGRLLYNGRVPYWRSREALERAATQR